MLHICVPCRRGGTHRPTQHDRGKHRLFRDSMYCWWVSVLPRRLNPPPILFLSRYCSLHVASRICVISAIYTFYVLLILTFFLLHRPIQSSCLKYWNNNYIIGSKIILAKHLMLGHYNQIILNVLILIISRFYISFISRNGLSRQLEHVWDRCEFNHSRIWFQLTVISRNYSCLLKYPGLFTLCYRHARKRLISEMGYTFKQHTVIHYGIYRFCGTYVTM